MSEAMFVELCDQLAGNIWLQGLLIAFGVCFLEDVARCAIGLLVVTGKINWWVAFSWMMIGSVLGDLGLYLIGRYAMAFCVGRGWIDAGRIAKMKLYFSRHAIKSIIGARFFPGARTVAYAAAGATHYKIFKFLAVLAAVTVAQTLLYLYGTALFGERILGYFQSPTTRWVATGVLLTIIIGGHFIVQSRGRKRVEGRIDPPL